MPTREQHIQAIKQEVGWAYPQLKWLTAEEAAQATEDRDQLLRALAGKVNESFLQNKLHQGREFR
ncbi:MAG: hypothetical protein H8D43_04330 [Chloroflexi bacterium]|nr:hypothetical protein [Chloroflexota bacterium]